MKKPPRPDAVEPWMPRRRLVQGLGSAPLLGLLSACGGSGGSKSSSDSTSGDSNSGGGSGSSGGSNPTDGASEGSGSSSGGSSGSGSDQPSTTQGFTHPGLMHTEADFARMQTKVAAGAEPWLAGFNALATSWRAQLGREPTPTATILRGGDGQNFRLMVEDMQRAYQFALRWKASGDTAYADEAVKYLDAWSSTLTALSGNGDRFLGAGLYGYQWANAGEIMRTYSGWSAEGLARLQKMLLELFYPLAHEFLVTHNGSNVTNHWANWDLCCIAAVLAIGVFCDRRDLYDEALAYYKTGRGNGAITHSASFMHPGHLGQWQESARDQGHATLSLGLAALVCEMAWNQGDDLYGHANNRFLAGAEYLAKANLKDENDAFYTLPFSPYMNRQGSFSSVSDAGRPNGRPIWESIYNHYVNRKGLSAPWVTRIATQLRPQRGEWVGDVPSFGTLSFTREPFTGLNAPSGLTAYPTAGQVLLSWWGSANASSYNVKRAASASGPFTTIASNITDPRTYTDSPGKGTWYYAITSVGSSGESAASSAVRVVLPGELHVHLKLDAGSGTTAADSSGKGRNGTLVGGAGWGEGRNGGKALQLDGSDGHLALPAGVMSSLGDFTIALWVYWNNARTWARVFDFGAGDIDYMTLMAQTGTGQMRFCVTNTSNFGEQSIVANSALPTGRWVHLAVTLSGTTGTLYVDGAPAGSNNSIALAPFQLGETKQNWLGRSQYRADPYFNGRMQDLRIYSGALSASDIAALAAA